MWYTSHNIYSHQTSLHFVDAITIDPARHVSQFEAAKALDAGPQFDQVSVKCLRDK